MSSSARLSCTCRNLSTGSISAARCGWSTAKAIWRPVGSTYNTKQIGLARQALHSDDPYARTRAAHNLKTLQAESESLKQTAQEYRGNAEVAQQLQTNSAVQSGLGVNTGRQADQSQQGEEIDNRTRLGAFYKSQSNASANDVVNSAGTSFSFSNDIKFQQGSFGGGKEAVPGLPAFGSPAAQPTGPAKDAGDEQGQAQGQGSGGKGANEAGNSFSRLGSELRNERQDLGQSDAALPGDQLGAADASGSLPPRLSAQLNGAPGQNDEVKLHYGGRLNHGSTAEEPDFAETGGDAEAARSLKRYAGRVAQQDRERGPADYAVNGGEMKRASAWQTWIQSTPSTLVCRPIRMPPSHRAASYSPAIRAVTKPRGLPWPASMSNFIRAG